MRIYVCIHVHGTVNVASAGSRQGSADGVVVFVSALQGVVCVVHVVLHNVDECCGALPRSLVM